MITSIEQLDLSKKYSYADYLTWKFDEYVELLRGHISRMAAPTRLHQRIALRMGSFLEIHLRGRSCEANIAPFDVRLLDQKKSTADKDVFTVVQPDVCVVCDLTKLDDKGCVGAPDLIIEILSPGTQKKDVTDKYELYEFNGVKEYWIIASQDETITVFDLDDEKGFQLRKIYTGDDVLFSKAVEGFNFELPRLFSVRKFGTY